MKNGKFEAGDKVRVKKPDNIHHSYSWNEFGMDKYDGKVYRVKGVTIVGVVLLEGCVGKGADPQSFWSFDAAWLTLVESIEGMCQDCGGEMKDVQLLTSITKICPKCEK
jgi:hypothetical protein